ncbi:hypothetical protein GJ744_003983 [Endocarpon pusillum]|uniref:Uncharacterized protein n=1 Tax=Endocarpon pusillum TaxID=364733 RepID=A0A8H7A9W7_9EURO|nr:hypothetical protein GJ744_003983 [Endocarpon pusillum]
MDSLSGTVKVWNMIGTWMYSSRAVLKSSSSPKEPVSISKASKTGTPRSPANIRALIPSQYRWFMCIKTSTAVPGVSGVSSFATSAMIYIEIGFAG